MTHPLFDLTDRVALVSGAAQGMGRAVALAFAEVGANLVLADINTTGVQATAEHIRKLGRRAIPITCDVTNLKHIDALFAQLDGEYGKIDVLANIAGPATLGKPEDITVTEMEQVIHGLVVARFACCQEAGRRMLAAGKGSIINIGSIGGLTSLGRGHVAYGVAMGGVVQMTRELSTEWSGRGVRVNAVFK